MGSSNAIRLDILDLRWLTIIKLNTLPVRREYSDVDRHYLTLFKTFPEDLGGYSNSFGLPITSEEGVLDAFGATRSGHQLINKSQVTVAIRYCVQLDGPDKTNTCHWPGNPDLICL
jgi:hypothetical protein